MLVRGAVRTCEVGRITDRFPVVIPEVPDTRFQPLSKKEMWRGCYVEEAPVCCDESEVGGV